MRKIYLKKILRVAYTLCLLISFTSSYAQLNDAVVKEVYLKGVTDSVQVVATGDIVGTSKDELIMGSNTTLYIYDVVGDAAHVLHTVTYPQQILRLHSGDADNDGKNELIVVTGNRRYADNTEVKAYLLKYDKDGFKQALLYAKLSPRPYATYLDIGDVDNDGRNEIVVSYYESKYIVETVALSQKGSQWESQLLEKKRMATARDMGVLPGSDRVQSVVGRVYGDSAGVSGDAYIVNGAEYTALPVYRGVRLAMVIGNGDNDGDNEIYLGDGWHSDFGKIARGRLAVVKYDGKIYDYNLIEDTKGQYSIAQIEIADVTGDGKHEVVTLGNKFFRIYKYDNKQGWGVFSDTTVGYGQAANQFAIGDINGDGHQEVIFSGMHYTKDVGVKIYNFYQLDFSTELGEEVITEKMAPEELIGKVAPSLNMEVWYNGAFDSIKKSKGKVIILDFWATWCQPCIRMFPLLEEWQKKYGDDGLQILGITRLDDSQSMQKVEDFVKENHFLYPIGVTKEAFAHLSYGVQSIPHLVLIDKNGIVRKYEVGLRNGDALEKELVRLLNE